MPEQTNEQIDKNAKKILLTLVLLVIITIIVVFFIKDYTKQELSKEEMICISQNSKLYVSSGCTHCLQQEQDLEPYDNLFNITDCLKYKEECGALNIVQVPTWIINNKTYIGVQSLNSLKNYTNC